MLPPPPVTTAIRPAHSGPCHGAPLVPCSAATAFPLLRSVHGTLIGCNAAGSLRLQPVLVVFDTCRHVSNTNRTFGGGSGGRTDRGQGRARQWVGRGHRRGGGAALRCRRGPALDQHQHRG